MQQFGGVKVIKSGDVMVGEWAISPDTAGSKTLVFGSAKVPGGARVPAHYHTSETAALLIRGRAVLRTGEKLDQELEMVSGDYAYVGANVIHEEETLGDEVAEFIMAQEQGVETIPVDESDPGWALLQG